jgi:SAM-dependent methyltransferase
VTAVRAWESELEWGSRVVPEAHVERLATLARLCGLRPAPVEACRVLELGGEGGCQLLPMALALPGSQFVGLGGSAPALAAGRRLADELGLSNLTLCEGDLEDLPESLGSFDYVLVHGTHCFTSIAAREAALWALNRRLSASGIGYVSFRSLPGALISGAARHLLDAYLAADPGAGTRAERIRRIATLLASSLEPTQSLTLALKLELDEISRAASPSPWLESSDALGLPLYFDDFARALAPHALAYFTEAVPGDDDVTRLSSAARDGLGQFVNSAALWQQSLDLFTGRSVRHALVRRASLSVERAPLLETMREFVVGCSAELQILDGQLRLQAGSKAVAHVSDPGVSRAFVQLTRSWPEFVPFSALSEQISRDNPAERDARELALAEQLHRLFRVGVVELRLQAPRCTARPGERPVASPLARRMASVGGSVLNQHQRLVPLPSSEARQLLSLCDGGRTREQLLAAWSGERAPDLDSLLERLARLGLMVE